LTNGILKSIIFYIMSVKFLSIKNLPLLIQRLSEKLNVYYPVKINGAVHYRLYRGEELDGVEIYSALCSVRPVQPLKDFFITQRERVAKFKGILKKDIKKSVIIGAKNCDIRSISEIQDKVYLEGVVEDPFYRERRENTVLVSADCPEPADTCFCNIMGGKPYGAVDSDINISFSEKGYVFDVITKKGEDLLSPFYALFEDAKASVIRERDEKRKKAEGKLKEINPKKLYKNLPDRVKYMHSAEFWNRTMEGCVDCQACERVCPTCYCFLLYDVPVGEKSFERVRVLDYCYHASYARVGGGLNPLSVFSKRLRNRFECKFYSFFENHKVYACTGCGRCIEACMGKIDIRKVLFAL